MPLAIGREYIIGRAEAGPPWCGSAAGRGAGNDARRKNDECQRVRFRMGRQTRIRAVTEVPALPVPASADVATDDREGRPARRGGQAVA